MTPEESDRTLRAAEDHAIDDAWVRGAAAGHRLDQLLLAAASENADLDALSIGGADVTYRELFGRASLLAEQLRSEGARPESFVAVFVDRSVEAVVGLLSVILSGAAYVPIDTTGPWPRAREVVRRSSARLATGTAAHGLARALHLRWVPMPAAARTGTLVRPDRWGSPEDTAYAIFTSGSGGAPKGVVTTHAAIVNSTCARFGVFPWRPMTYLMLAPLTFDAALAGLYFTLAAGGRLLVPTADEVQDPGLLAHLLTRQAATHLDGVPSQYAAMLEYYPNALARLSCIVVAGEALAQGLVQRHSAALPNVPLFNEYGPTESTVWATCHRTDPSDDGPYAPIGRPIDGVDVEVVDDDLQIVAAGETGQLALSGRQLARGYLDQPELTAQRFVQHPRRPGHRLYLTGDRGRRDQEGRLVYCGRMDSMVKVRGYRVELGEVEMSLRQEPDVVDAVVLPEEFSGTQRLVAVTVMSARATEPPLPTLRSRLAERLPSYMVPTRWHRVERLPLTPHGKVDRRAVAQLVGVAPPRGFHDPAPPTPTAPHGGESVPDHSVHSATTLDPPESQTRTTLTQIEWTGLTAEHNLADGHARQGASPRAQTLLDRLPDLYREAERRPQLEVQQQFEQVFYGAAGQPSVLERPRGLMHHYSSSLSIEVVANHLRIEGLSVGLLHPTFDNLHDILHRHGVVVRPVTEEVFERPDDPACWGDYDALFLVTPNNPTGLDPSPHALESIALECKKRGVLLIVDFSFRFFSDHLADRDFYSFVEENEVDHIGIEDVGKVWPMLDLKVGTLVSGPLRHSALQVITDDLLLNVSPFVFALLAESAGSDVFDHARRISVRNRAMLVHALADGPLEVVHGGATMSVAWIRLPPGWDCTALGAWLESRGVVVLPGRPFFWADPDQGSRFIRVALMRPSDDFEVAAAALARAVGEYAP